MLCLPRKLQLIVWKQRKSIAPATQKDCRHVCRHVRMSGCTTPATQRQTFEKDRFCNFPIDTATAPENQRSETRHVGASKRAFRARLPQISIFRSSKTYTFSHELFYDPTSKSMFRARLPSIFITCHACHWICTLSPLQAALTSRFTKNTTGNTSEILRLPRNMTSEVSKMLRLPQSAHLPRDMKLHDAGNIQKSAFLEN